MSAASRAASVVLTGAVEVRGLAQALAPYSVGGTRTRAPAPFQVLDTFDAAVAASGQALIQMRGMLELFEADAPPVSQSVNAAVRTAGELPEGPVKARLSGVSMLRRLMPRAEGRARRLEVAIVDDEGKTVARLSLLHLRCDEEAGVTVAAVEGLRGYDDAFERVTGSLARIGGSTGGSVVAPGELSGILSTGTPVYNPKPCIEMPRGSASFDVANRIVVAHLAIARINEEGIQRDWDTVFLHEYRIAFRKIRSVVSLFRGVYSDRQRDALRAMTGRLMARTGRLRDLDVYLLDKAMYFDLVPASLHEGLDLLFARFATERSAEQRALARWLAGTDYEEEMQNLGRLFTARRWPEPGPLADLPVEQLAHDLIGRSWRKARACARKIDATTPDEVVHDLRVRCKKLRYLLEFFAPLIGEDAFGPLIRPLRRLQDELGLFNDYSVQIQSLEGIVDSGSPRRHDDIAIARSIGALTAVLHQRQIAQRRKVDGILDEFTGPKVRRKFERWIEAGDG